MKKILLAFAAIALAVSCGGDKFTVQGSIDPEMVEQGDFVIMKDNFSPKIDTAQIVGGKFTFSGPASVETIKQVILVSGGRTVSSSAAMFIPEAGTIEISLDADGTLKGGALNNALNAYNQAVAGIVNDYSAKSRELGLSLTGDALQEAISKAADDAQSRLDKINLDTYKANKTNALGFLTLSDMVYYFETVDDFDKAMEGAADFIVNYEPFQEIRASIEAAEKSAEGSMFIDFKGTTADGKPLSLSDYVGKGKWVLVDFWASWCVPCKEEIPNIIATYNKYAGKDFTVIGVPVWDEREDTDVALKQLGIKYDQIYVGDDRTPTDVYGITGIPHIILFAPDGTIAKRDLRGTRIEGAVKEALQK